MALPLAAMAVGSAISLITTAIADLMQSGETDPNKIEAVRRAQGMRTQELEGEGMAPAEAYLQAKRETAEAMANASESTDAVTAGDYALNTGLGAALAFVPGAGAVGRAASGAMGKVASFLGRGKPAIPNTNRGLIASGASAPASSTYEPGFRGGRPKDVSADVWPEDPVIGRHRPGQQRSRLESREPKTIDTTAEVVQPRLGMADDALLNPAVDDIIEAAMRQEPLRLGMGAAAKAPISKQAQMERMRALRDLASSVAKEEAWRRSGR